MRRKNNLTELKIIQTAINMFTEKGFSQTTVKAIGDQLGISSGHVMFYFPSKEHMLTVLVDILCDFQWQRLNELLHDRQSPLTAMCRELQSMATMCKDNPVAKDFFISFYTHSMTLDIIRRNDAVRAKILFGEYCCDWSDEQYAVAECMVSGIEYALLMTTDFSPNTDMLIKEALDSIMKIYNVPQETRQREIKQIFQQTSNIYNIIPLKEFTDYVHQMNGDDFSRRLEKLSMIPATTAN